MVTTDVTDGYKTSLNIGKTEVDKIEFDEHQDGTYDKSYESKKKESPKPKQKTLENFFAKSKSDKGTAKVAMDVKVLDEEIDVAVVVNNNDNSNNEEESKEQKPVHGPP